MSTAEIDEPSNQPPPVIVLAARSAIAAAGADDRLKFRALLALALTGGCVVLAPLPFNIIGAVSAVITAIEVARLAWRK